MNIIIPMAGRGTRLRPHTLTIPKPLIKVAGKTIVQHLCEDLATSTRDTIHQIAFVVHPSFGKETEEGLLQIAASLNAKGSIHYQEKPEGTAHAILCAAEVLKGHCIVAFADTLFVADFKLDESKDGIIWVNHVKNPEQFGVVKISTEGNITDFVEKPREPVSDLAIIGIYYFKDGEILRSELQYLIDNNIKDKGEYQLTNALENMKNKGLIFAPAEVKEWLDCGNYQSTIFTNTRVLVNKQENLMIPVNTEIVNSVIVQPCFIGENVKIFNSVVGPHASIGAGSVIEGSIIHTSIVQEKSFISNANLANSMLGSNIHYSARPEELSLGDFSVKC